MFNGIYLFTKNDFLQFKDKKNGVAIFSRVYNSQNPSLCGAEINLIVSPKFEELSSDYVKVIPTNNNLDVSFRLSRDLRQPTACSSCTPLSREIENGWIIGNTGSWVFENIPGTGLRDYTVYMGGENDLWYVPKRENVSEVVLSRLEYIAKRINLVQKTLEDIGAISRAPVIESSHVYEIGNFIRETRPTLLKKSLNSL